MYSELQTLTEIVGFSFCFLQVIVWMAPGRSDRCFDVGADDLGRDGHSVLPGRAEDNQSRLRGGRSSNADYFRIGHSGERNVSIGLDILFALIVGVFCSIETD